MWIDRISKSILLKKDADVFDKKLLFLLLDVVCF